MDWVDIDKQKRYLLNGTYMGEYKKRGIMDDKHKLLCAEKSYFRGGGIMKRILSKPEKYLSGEEILSLFNTYGIGVRELKLLIMSHGCDGDYQEFLKLLDEQRETSKNMKNPILDDPCQSWVSFNQD